MSTYQVRSLEEADQIIREHERKTKTTYALLRSTKNFGCVDVPGEDAGARHRGEGGQDIVGRGVRTLWYGRAGGQQWQDTMVREGRRTQGVGHHGKGGQEGTRAGHLGEEG